MREMAQVGTIVAIRYHNVICALKLCKPTLSLSYARKHDLLMGDMGLSEFCLPAKTFDVDRLIERFTELRSRSAELAPAMADRNAEKAKLLDEQFAELSRLLFPKREQERRSRQPRARCPTAFTRVTDSRLGLGVSAPGCRGSYRYGWGCRRPVQAVSDVRDTHERGTPPGWPVRQHRLAQPR